MKPFSRLFVSMESKQAFYKFAASIFLFSLVTHLTIFLIFWSNWSWHSGAIHDQWNLIGISLAESGTFGFRPDEPSLLRSPAFPVFEAILYFLFGESYSAWSITLLLVNCITCLLVVFCAKDLWGNRVGLLAGIFYASYVPVIYYTAKIEQFTIVLPILLIWIYLFSYWYLKSAPKSLPWILGLFSGLLILNKSVYLFFPIIGVGSLLWLHRNHNSFKKDIQRGLIVLAVTVLTTSPWMYRNYEVSEGRIIPVQLLLWYNFWADIHWDELDEAKGMIRPPGMLSDYISEQQKKLIARQGGFPAEKVVSTKHLPKQELTSARSEVVVEDMYEKAAWEWIQQNPEKLIKKTLKNTWQFWFGAENLQKTRLFFIMQAFFIGLVIFGLWNIVKYHQMTPVWFLLLPVLMLWSQYSLIYSMGRFSLDLAPAFAILFGIGIDIWFRKHRSNA